MLIEVQWLCLNVYCEYALKNRVVLYLYRFLYGHWLARLCASKIRALQCHFGNAESSREVFLASIFKSMLLFPLDNFVCL
jgi:hypothetical protein